MSSSKIACKSEYVTMRDGIRLAVSAWLPSVQSYDHKKYTAVVTITRYGRAMEFKQDCPELQSFYLSACYLFAHGYVLVAVDARGSGASFGVREGEASVAEVADIGEVIAWVAHQDWCDGRVATTGASYSGITTLCSLVSGSPALKLGVCRAPDFDLYRHLFAPGGIVNHWFIDAWGHATSALDKNDMKALFRGGYWPHPDGALDNLLGVRPVDDDKDKALLTSAIADHKANYNVADAGDRLTFIDRKPFGCHLSLFESPYKENIENGNTPVVIRCGWHDAGTALGALSMFTSIRSPIQLIIGPWSHEGTFLVDPFKANADTHAEPIPIDDERALRVKSLDVIFQKEQCSEDGIHEQFGWIDYYTLGENAWKTTGQWPLPDTQFQRLYLAEGGSLSKTANTSLDGSDSYWVDQTATTGLNNRWHAQSAAKPILFPDRRQEDKRLLVYNTPVLERDTEITGHPVVHLYIRSDASDGQFFVYLEMVDPDGQVRMLTEGQLRALHRKVSLESPPYKMFGPYHSLKEKDAQYLIPGEIAEITFDLFPISVLLKKGQQIRLAIACADKDTFSPIANLASQKISVERNCVYASFIDLPVIH
ncbi:CocE/NonD family hydrolase [SAR92 clade bacterium H231]|nr:CocE/NonD family hydrolase [SAR92 clade bacterium H231]